MIKRYVTRGIAAGAIAGIPYGVFMAAVANPLLGYAERIAEHGHEHGHEAGPAVSELTTQAVSVGGGVLWGILLGAAFGLAYYFLEPSLPGRGTVKSYVLAGGGFLTVSAVPWLALPPAIPGAEYALAPRTRILVYAGLMVLGAVVAAASVGGYLKASGRGRVVAIAVAAVPVVAVAVAVPALAPEIVLVGELPADLVAAYRGLVALSQAALWALLAGSHGWLRNRTGDAPGGTVDAPTVDHV